MEQGYPCQSAISPPDSSHFPAGLGRHVVFQQGKKYIYQGAINQPNPIKSNPVAAGLGFSPQSILIWCLPCKTQQHNQDQSPNLYRYFSGSQTSKYLWGVTCNPWGRNKGFFTEEEPPLFPCIFLGTPAQLQVEQHLWLRLWEARGRGSTAPSPATPFSLQPQVGSIYYSPASH